MWQEIGNFFAELRSKAEVGDRGERMPDLELPDRRRGGDRVRRYTYACIQAAGDQCQSARRHSYCCAALPDSDRSHAPPIYRGRTSKAARPVRRTERWGQTLRNLLWTHASVNVPPFEDATVVDLPVPCTFDFNVAATKYFHGLGDGEVPLCLMFSGTVFYSQDGGSMQVAPISWDKEARFRLPVKVWRDMMDTYYPEQRLAVPAPRRFRAALSNTRCGTGFPPGKRRWRACWPAEETVRS